MYKVIANGEDVQQNVVEIVADEISDITDLQTETDKPTTYYGAGSSCIVLEDSSVWMLGNDRKWHQL